MEVLCNLQCSHLVGQVLRCPLPGREASKHVAPARLDRSCHGRSLGGAHAEGRGETFELPELLGFGYFRNAKSF